jgi:hypothetical protein
MSGTSRPLVSDASAMVRLLDRILGPRPTGACSLSAGDVAELHEQRDMLRESVASSGAGTTVGLAPGRTFRTGGAQPLPSSSSDASSTTSGHASPGAARHASPGAALVSRLRALLFGVPGSREG